MLSTLYYLTHIYLHEYTVIAYPFHVMSIQKQKGPRDHRTSRTLARRSAVEHRDSRWRGTNGDDDMPSNACKVGSRLGGEGDLTDRGLLAGR